MEPKTEKLGKILIKSTFVNRCVCCGVRYRKTNADYCSYCIGRFERKKTMTPATIEKTVIELVQPKYADAVIDEADKPIRDKLRERETRQDVFLYGLPGRGKTYLFAALIRSYVTAGYSCMRISFDEFCCKVRSTMQPGATQTEWELTEQLKAVDLLFIDDLGLSTKEASDFVYNTFFLTLNKRQERLLPTFISSNKSLDQLKKTLFDARIISRLSTALVIEMTGPDRRKEKRYQNETIKTAEKVSK